MVVERVSQDRVYFRVLVAEFRENFPFQADYLIQTRANEIGAKIDFGNDSVGEADNLDSYQRAAIRGASKAQVSSWPEDLRRKAKDVEAMLKVLYPLGERKLDV